MEKLFSRFDRSSSVVLDGYIRMTFDDFRQVRLDHRMVWEDECLRQDLIDENIPASRAGYCEWASREQRAAVSIGWAWFVLSDGTPFLAPGAVNSNVMLVTKSGCDLGMQRTHALLRKWVCGNRWQRGVPGSRGAH